MIVMNVPTLLDGRVVWVKATVVNGVVFCTDPTVKRDIEMLRPIGGPPASDPEPDWTLGRECERWLNAKVIQRTPNGNPDAPEVPGVCFSGEPLLLPVRAEGPDGTIGDGAIEIWPGHPQYEQRRAELARLEQVFSNSGRKARKPKTGDKNA